MNIAFWKAAAERAIKTFAQAALALLGTGSVGITSLDWRVIASVAATAAVASLLTSLASLSNIVPGAPVTATQAPAASSFLPPVSLDITAPASVFPKAAVEAAVAAEPATVEAPAAPVIAEPAPVAPVFEAPAEAVPPVA